MRNVYKITLFIGMLAFIISCKKSFLEILPKGRVIASKTSDYDLLLNNLDVIVITGSDGQVLPGDEVTVKEPAWSGASHRDKQLFKWDFNIYTPEEDARETLTPVKGLYLYNKIINEVMEATDGSEAIKKSLQAEAYAGRAWTYFLLINYYGKPYNPATAATDPGFPLMMKADINAGPHTRATVQEIYDLIVSDLTTAIPNLTQVGVPHRSRMSKAAAQGLLAKVYIFMGKYAEALPLLNESISNLSQSAVPTALYNLNTTNPGFPTAPNDQENVYAKVMTNGYLSGSQSLVFLTPEAEALYGATDMRRTRYLTNSFTFPNGLKLLRRGSTTVSFWGVRVPELHLFRAELLARKDDLAAAVAELEFFRNTRMPAADAKVPLPVQANKLALLQFIMEERIREFSVMGYRWFDMRRLSVDPLFGTINFVHKVYDANGAVKETFTLNNVNQFVFRIPPKILGENPQMKDNP
ncbi:RagB/SusD family nutrient uptake outer membrane protein [Segetibacter sp. 3557_3]|uniref:RagB/SusD family nutrient uptake outer membrane protein n=1 Tax=Segetibacter sp. 3557_3 TaxID=2547429 RepID=UPI00105884BD|nr:RagB/SusD family nutrient uptake outer membrane protein [Segetibacter sp. 3557_3]TDH20688.1 RagB/SusD family nutrient uptake outer membrane protein [Segetibacter sp. 3557_3]